MWTLCPTCHRAHLRGVTCLSRVQQAAAATFPCYWAIDLHTGLDEPYLHPATLRDPETLSAAGAERRRRNCPHEEES